VPPTRFDLIRHAGQIALVWGIDSETLERVTDGDQASHYERLEIPKRGRGKGEVRVVFKAQAVLAQFHKNLARDLVDTVTFPDCVQGFVPRRSAVSNADRHRAPRLVLHVDIRNFFDSIPITSVENVFRGLGCNDRVVALLARATTLNDRLPQGASTSPVLANLVCAELDRQLELLAAATRCRYTRYADDLTFSGDDTPPLDAIERILAGHGFQVRRDKVRTQKQGASQFVTGLSVAHPNGPRVPRGMKRQLRAELYYARKYGITSHLARTGNPISPWRALAVWRGWIDYMQSAPQEQATAQRLRAQLGKLSVG
jgi:RNA-directed DNA polymerase